MKRINKQRVYGYYNKKNKWMGIIDYKTLTFCLVYIFIVIKIAFSLNFSITVKLYIIINFILPLLIFVALNIDEESIIDKLKIIIAFFMFRRVYTKSQISSFNGKIYAKNVEKKHIEKSK